MTRQQQRKNTPSQNEQRKQEEIHEEQWKTQKKKHQKSKDQANSKAVWRSVSPPMQRTSCSHRQEQGIAGISKLPTQNTFSKLEMLD